MRRQQGFTLFELIITLAIAAIVVGLAAPSFSSMVQDNRLSSQSLDFIAALNLARSEAIKRGSQVTLCKSDDGLSCKNAGDWAQGWIVFLDNDASNSRDTADDSTETILRVHPALAGGNRLTGNNPVQSFIAYTPRGNTSTIGTLALCDPRKDDAKGRAIIINSTGRARVTSVDESTLSCAS